VSKTNLLRRNASRMLHVVAACSMASLGQTAHAQALDQSAMVASDVELLADYEAYNSRCRGNSGDDPETWVACGARDYIGYLLNISGYCFGQSDQAEFEAQWHVCTDTSNRFEKP
jgi:hypothetical protein